MTIRFLHRGVLIEQLNAGAGSGAWRIGKGGGSAAPDIRLPADPLASRDHALLHARADGLHIEDCGSTNGTFVNGRRLPPGLLHRLSAGDELQFGSPALTAEVLPPPDGWQARRPMLQLIGLHKQFGPRRPGFQPLHLSLAQGALLGIIGPSGCGKSTLIQVLAGALAATGGGLLIAGHPATLQPQAARRFIGYVPQQDQLYGRLTVLEQLRFTARLRLGGLRRAETEVRINTTLAQLHLGELRLRCIETLSSGQRKRVAIAAELLSRPALLLLDEPTSPLDPHSAAALMQLLRGLCRLGTTVVMVSHRPEDLPALDALLALGKGGWPLYYGPPAECQRHFGAGSIAAVYHLLSHPENPAFAAHQQAFADAAASRQADLDAAGSGAAGTRQPSGGAQLRWLLARAFRLKLADRRALLLYLLQAPVIALLIALIFEELSVSVLFLLVLAAVWLGISNAAREVVGERAAFRHERLFGLRAGAYQLSKLILLAVPALLQALTFSLVLALRYASATVPLTSPVAAAGWLAALILAASTLGLAASAHARSTEQVTAAAPLLLLPQILLGGVLTGISLLGVETLSWLTFSRWGTEGLAILQDRVAVEDFPPGDAEGTARTLLHQQYHAAYAEGSIFGSLTGTLLLDAAALIFLSVACLLVMRAGLRRNS